MRRRLIISDFDRTLFDINNFLKDTAEELVRSGHVSQEQANKFLASVVTKKGNSVDMYDFLEEHGLDIVGIKNLIQQKFKDRMHIYSDVVPFIESHKNDIIFVLTTGREESQVLKLELIKEISHIQQKVIPGNKGEYVKSHIRQLGGTLKLGPFSGGRTYDELFFIDDREDVLAHLVGEKNVKLFHIVREDAKYTCSAPHNGIIDITSLKEVM